MAQTPFLRGLGAALLRGFRGSVGRGASRTSAPALRRSAGLGTGRDAASPGSQRGRSRPSGNGATPLTSSPSPAAAGPPPASPARLLPRYPPRQSRQSELPGDASPLTPSERREVAGAPRQRGFLSDSPAPGPGGGAGWGGRCLSVGRFAGRTPSCRAGQEPASDNALENCHRGGVTEEGFPVLRVGNVFTDIVLFL